MADKDVKLNIQTTADTKGAEQVEDRLERLKKRTEELLASSDEVSAAGGDPTGDPAPQADTEIKDQMSQMLRIQYAGLAREIGQGISSIARALHDTAQASAVADPALSKTLENTAVGLDSLSMGLTAATQGFAVGGPMGAAIGGLVGLMAGPLKSTLDDYKTQLDLLWQAEMAAAESVARFQRARANLANQIKHENLEDFFKRELSLIDQQVTAIERRSKVMAADRAASAAEREAGQASNAGDPKQTFAQRTVADSSGDFADAKAAIQAEVDKAVEIAAQLDAKAVALSAKASEIEALEGEMDTAAVAAREAARIAREAADNSQADADAAGEIATSKIRELIAGFSTRLGVAAEVVEKEAAGEAQAIIDKVTAGGAALTAQQQLAKQTIEKILEDGRVTAEEQTQLQQSLTTLISGMKGGIDAMQSAFAEANKITGALASQTAALKDEQNRIRQQVNQISSR